MADQDLQIKISTTAELAALRGLETELRKVVVAARALGKFRLPPLRGRT